MIDSPHTFSLAICACILIVLQVKGATVKTERVYDMISNDVLVDTYNDNDE